MTDADVDGAHIRTLLLTLFETKMKPLIDNGHVFIAQPPLYKLKKGKSQKYINDDNELNKYISNDIGANFQVRVNNQLLNEKDLVELLDNYSLMHIIISQFSSKRDKLILHNLAFFDQLSVDILRDVKLLKAWAESFTKYVNINIPINIRFEISASPVAGDDGLYSLDVTKNTNGVRSKLEPLNKHFFSSDNYLDLTNLGFSNFRDSNFTYSELSSNSFLEGYSLTQCFEALIKKSRGSISLQRYKGLGEMNPNQLEETTMNTKSRTLLKVMPLEDGNQVVVELMGDDVEMRKQFIKQRYSSVKNLDI